MTTADCSLRKKKELFKWKRLFGFSIEWIPQLVSRSYYSEWRKSPCCDQMFSTTRPGNHTSFMHGHSQNELWTSESEKQQARFLGSGESATYLRKPGNFSSKNGAYSAVEHVNQCRICRWVVLVRGTSIFNKKVVNWSSQTSWSVPSIFLDVRAKYREVVFFWKQTEYQCQKQMEVRVHFLLFVLSLISCLSSCIGYSCLKEDSIAAALGQLRPKVNCSAFSLSVAQFCCKTPEEAQFPDDACAPSPWVKDACQGGFFKNTVTNSIEVCPEGFYCPEDVLCIVPCPTGAFCTPSRLVPAKRSNDSAKVDRLGCDRYQNGTVLCCKPDYKTLRVTGRKEGSHQPMNFTCGGPKDLSRMICPRGHYCPNTTHDPIPCPRGHYCRPGSTHPRQCPWLSNCGMKTSAPIMNGLGLFIDLVLVIILLVGYVLNKHRSRIKRWWRSHTIAKKRRRSQRRQDAIDIDDATLSLNASPSSRCHGNDARSPSWDIGQSFSTTALIPGPKSTSGTDAEAPIMITPKKFTISIAFTNLCLKLKEDGRTILQNATGHLKPKHLTAIMGGSGAGKTTLLNALSGKAYYGHMEGDILINGRPDKISRYRSITGFVPQDDIMHRTLTVFEVTTQRFWLRPASESVGIDRAGGGE